MSEFGDALRTFQKKLDEIKHRAQELDGSHITMPEMFPDDFMRRHTDFRTIQEMFDHCGIEMETEEDVVRALEDPDWNAFVVSRTRFAGWDAMVEAAGEEMALKKLR